MRLYLNLSLILHGCHVEPVEMLQAVFRIDFDKLPLTKAHRSLVIARNEAILMHSLNSDRCKIASSAEKAFSQ